MRTFLCIPVDPSIRDHIASVAAELRVHVDTRASWVIPENYHVTVRFLGEIDPLLTVDLKETCQTVTSQIASFEIPLDRVGGFPSLDNPRVLWAGGKAPVPFRNLLSLLDSGLLQLGFPHSRAESLAHITLARVKGRLRAPLTEAIKQITQPSWTLHADWLVLMESRLTPQGAVYSPLFTFPFAKEKDGVRVRR
ncbi:MAG TPA: RNA 2',3'-cyclic phosphodiesterase [Candidatus Acetothermia bacterium]|nr:RNA 2',3'-cyclic phosphodiesterase [Candidatus Acetothermia bacterium]